MYEQGLPWWSVVKNPPTGQETRFDPWSRKIPHTSEQLQPLSHTYWACALQQEKAPQGEAHVPQLESSPFSLHPEKSPRSNEDPAQP